MYICIYVYIYVYTYIHTYIYIYIYIGGAPINSATPTRAVVKSSCGKRCLGAGRCVLGSIPYVSRSNMQAGTNSVEVRPKPAKPLSWPELARASLGQLFQTWADLGLPSELNRSLPPTRDYQQSCVPLRRKARK